MQNLIKALELMGIEYNDNQIDTLRRYMDEILNINEHINITAIIDHDEFIQKHYIDSLLCSDSKAFIDSHYVIDVGTGGGFPGIPLAVLNPGKKFVLMDSLNKRIKIIQQLCDQLGVSNVTAVHGRAEELARNKDYRESFDVCVSRAVANMSTLSEYCLPFVKPGGTFIAYKGPECEDEIQEASKAIQVMGGGEVNIIYPDLDCCDFKHALVYVNKENKTPKSYPRKSGTPSKEPLK